MSAQLHYKIEGDGPPLVLLHGLFGNLDNLGLLARDLKNDYQVIRPDLRNHGLSFQSPEHNYELMAEDVARLLRSLHLPPVTLIGHSMGGKVAMKLAATEPALVRELVVMDIAPLKYRERHHDNVFAGLFSVLEQHPSNRETAMQLLAQHIEMESVRQFLGKSLYKDGDRMTWRFQVEALYNNYEHILDWQPIQAVQMPTLFLKGANSDYISPEAQAPILEQFPQAKAHIVANTGHWLHAEKPQDVLRIIRKFLLSVG
ncbi:alpha/beta fold hydrolase [Vibrio mangrovi]|uniref:Alpha/beta fold hydrolase n=1 Tax=Vibrio mangrovi TaxID=474394 RepID=A0A1Y6IS47_9VIBR|nr:alpha/beta fold hydrolase [Vibrio mangrovi]MDW6001490.1 alpha/beta fold hydrolase [Vibrio mangrovi]SMS00487.1 Esterase YbfF [Vibrio mangrovi]